MDRITSVETAALRLSDCEVAAVPTESSYGLAATIDCPKALGRIFRIKKRPSSKPLLLLVADAASAEALSAHPFGQDVWTVVKAFWPGPLTILVAARPGLPGEVTAGTGKVALRVSSHPVAAALAKRLSIPFTATSANLSGLPPCYSPEEIEEQLGEEPPDFILDAGVLDRRARPSTIVDVTCSPFRLVREGALTAAEIEKVAGRLDRIASDDQGRESQRR